MRTGRVADQQPRDMRMAMFTLQILHVGFLSGILLFSGVVIFLTVSASSTGGSGTPQSGGVDMDLFFAVILGAGLITIFPISMILLPSMRKKAALAAADAHTEQEPESAQLGAIAPYTTALLLRASLVEGWGLLGTIAALLTDNLLFLIAPLIAVGALAMYFPTHAKFDRFYTEAIEKAAKESFQ